jgi:hypothetical protein
MFSETLLFIPVTDQNMLLEANQFLTFIHDTFSLVYMIMWIYVYGYFFEFIIQC